MENYQKKHVYECALFEYGLAAQIDMLIEEMAELTTALLHDRRGRDANIPEEIADVLIVLEQIIQFFKMEDSVAEQKDRKLQRLAERIKAKGWDV